MKLWQEESNGPGEDIELISLCKDMQVQQSPQTLGVEGLMKFLEMIPKYQPIIKNKK